MTKQRGFTLVEVATILLALATLSAILLPEIATFTNKAKVVRAKEDVAAIGIAVQRYLDDVGECSVWWNANINTGVGDTAAPNSTAGPERLPANRVDMLIGDGDVPDDAVNVPLDHTGVADANVANWITAGPADGSTVMLGGGILDTIHNILINNTPASNPTNHARFVSEMSIANNYTNATGQFNQAFGWRGPYLNEATADPWGNRYAVSTEYADCVNGENSGGAVNDGTDGSDGDMIVLSAGPNEMVNTPWSSKALSTGGTDDDIFYVISGAATRR